MGGFAAQPRLPPRARGFARAVCQMAPHLRPWPAAGAGAIQPAVATAQTTITAATATATAVVRPKHRGHVQPDPQCRAPPPLPLPADVRSEPDPASGRYNATNILLPGLVQHRRSLQLVLP